jgi:hypothetical protein
MKKNVFLFSVMVGALALVGLGCTPTMDEPVVTPEPPAEAEQQPAYVGSWSRQALLVDGVPQDGVPAVLELGADAYVSTTSCTVSGRVETDGDAVTLTIDANDCPTGAAIPNAYHSTYFVSEDGQNLTLINTEFGAEVREEYVRQ